MPKFQKVRQNPPRLAKYRGMANCLCCGDGNGGTGSKYIRVLPSYRKGGKKADAKRRESSPSPKTDKISSGSEQCRQGKGSQGEPTGQGPERCDPCGSSGYESTDTESGGSTNCPSWDEARLCKPSEGHGKEWWEVLFEDIGIIPLLQPPYAEEHSYVMAEFQGDSPSSD